MIRNYYQFKVVSENLINAIFYHASICRDRGDGGQPGDATYGLLTELEHKNLTTLYKNVKEVKTFLFKGTKDEAAVGSNEEGVGVTVGTGPALGAEPGMLGSGAVDIASLVANSKAK